MNSDGNVVVWIGPWETLCAQPTCQMVGFLDMPTSQNLTQCQPTRAASLAGILPSYRLMRSTIRPAAMINHSDAGVESALPDALQIKGTLMGDHRCERTALGISEPSGTDPILAATVCHSGLRMQLNAGVGHGRIPQQSQSSLREWFLHTTFGVGTRCRHDFRIGIPLSQMELQSMLDHRWRIDGSG